MGWSIGYDGLWQRDIGYGVPARCDHPGCTAEIDRGLAFVCGGQPYGGEHGCGLYFCGKHLTYAEFQEMPDAEVEVVQACERCADGAHEPFTPSPDVPRWMRHKLTDRSWAAWRRENPTEVAAMRAALAALEAPCPPS